jgi:hypothetical protein
MSFEKWVDAGLGKYGRVFVAVKWDGSRLSITGVEGPKRNGDATGSCGQCIGALDWITEPLVDVARLRDVWNRWHLNDMRPACEHQRAASWGDETLEVGEKREQKRAGWVYQGEHPRGVLMKPCPECGYKYGSAWLREEVPADVIDYLCSLPASDACPWSL